MKRLPMNVNILLAAVCVLSPLTFGNIASRFSPPSAPPANKYYIVDPAWEVTEALTIRIDIQDGVNVYGWQANIIYDPTKLVVLEVKAGDFLAKNNIVLDSASPIVSQQDVDNFKIGDAMLCHSADVRPNLLLVFGFCWGDVPGVSGSGTVAEIKFGIYDNSAQPFYIDLGDPIIVDKQGTVLDQGLLTLEHF